MYRPNRIGPHPVLPLRDNPSVAQANNHQLVAATHVPVAITAGYLPAYALDAAAARERVCRTTYIGAWPQIPGYQHMAFVFLMTNAPTVADNYLYSYEITFAWHTGSGGDIFAFPTVGLVQTTNSRMQVYKDLNAESIAHDGQSVEFTARGSFVLIGDDNGFPDQLGIGVHIMNLSGTSTMNNGGDAMLSVYAERWVNDIPLVSPVM